MCTIILPLDIIELIYKFYFDDKLVCDSHLPILNNDLPPKLHNIEFVYYSVYYVNILPKTNVQNYLCTPCLRTSMEIDEPLDIDYCNYWYDKSDSKDYIYEIHNRLTFPEFMEMFIQK